MYDATIPTIVTIINTKVHPSLCNSHKYGSNTPSKNNPSDKKKIKYFMIIYRCFFFAQYPIGLSKCDNSYCLIHFLMALSLTPYFLDIAKTDIFSNSLANSSFVGLETFL